MSILIVDDAALCRLASFAADHQLLGDRSAEAFASELRARNIDAFRERYGATFAPLPPLVFDASRRVDAVELAGDLASYLYNVQPDPDGGCYAILVSIRRILHGLFCATDETQA